jgi:hypothetical protein
MVTVHNIAPRSTRTDPKVIFLLKLCRTKAKLRITHDIKVAERIKRSYGESKLQVELFK